MCCQPGIKPALHRLKCIWRGVVLSSLARAGQRRAAARNEFLLGFPALRGFHCGLFDKLRQRFPLVQDAFDLVPHSRRDAHWRQLSTFHKPHCSANAMRRGREGFRFGMELCRRPKPICPFARRPSRVPIG